MNRYVFCCEDLGKAAANRGRVANKECAEAYEWSEFESYLPEIITYMKETRLRLKLTQGRLAKIIGVSYVAVFRWENKERHPNLTNSQKIWQWLRSVEGVD